MKFLFDGYNLTPAVTTLRTLLFEYDSHNNEDRHKLVWKPTQAFFQELANSHPKQITCFFGDQTHFLQEPDCVSQRLYALNCQSEIAYIGTVMNQKAIAYYRKRLSEIGLPMLSGKRISRGMLHHCVIPITTETVNEVALMEAAKKFFKSFPQKTLIPSLADALICLLSAEKGAAIEKEILRLASQSAQPATRKEKVKKFSEDMDW